MTTVHVNQDVPRSARAVTSDAVVAPVVEPLRHRCLLVTGIPCYFHQGKRWIDRLWHIDLVRHLEYLPNFMLASPRRCEAPAGDSVCLSDDPRFQRVAFIDLPGPRSMLQGVLALPRTVAALWRAMADARVVHVGVANWPIPLGWMAVPIARLRRRFLLIVIESAFWRVASAEPASIRRRLRAFIHERLNRWCVRACHLRIFTHETYRREFLRRSDTGHVIPASWIAAEQVITVEQLAERRSVREANGARDVRILFAGRLLPEKGLEVLLDAAGRLSQTDAIRIDVMGLGPLEARCRAADGEREGRIRLIETLPYDRFLEAVRDYDAVVVPNVSDEQPRLVFDAFSQGVAVIGSATAGIRGCVTEGVTGRLTPPGDAAALAGLLAWASRNRDELWRMGDEALAVARLHTHQHMHHKRCEVLRDALIEANVQA